MVRLADTKEELRCLLTQEGPIDQAKCRRLILRATSRMSDLREASGIVDELGILVAEVDMAEMLGGERQLHIDLIMERLDEVEEMRRPI